MDPQNGGGGGGRVLLHLCLIYMPHPHPPPSPFHNELNTISWTRPGKVVKLVMGLQPLLKFHQISNFNDA